MYILHCEQGSTHTILHTVINPEDLMDEEEVIQTQPTADYQSIDSDDKQPITLS